MGSSRHGSAELEMNLTSIPEDAGLIPVFAQLINVRTLLWVAPSLAAVALIQLLAWELPYALGVALERQTNNFF